LVSFPLPLPLSLTLTLTRYPEAEAVVIEEGGGGDLPLAQPLPEERPHDERATAPLVLSSAAV